MTTAERLEYAARVKALMLEVSNAIPEGYDYAMVLRDPTGTLLCSASVQGDEGAMMLRLGATAMVTNQKGIEAAIEKAKREEKDHAGGN